MDKIQNVQTLERDIMELKKSYKGFWIWILMFVLVSLGCAFLPIESVAVISRIEMNICVIAIAVLAFMIYKTEAVYWYNGTTYEEAVKAGSERRKEFARRHFVRFGGFAAIFLVASVMMHILKVGFGADIFVGTIGMVVLAISTINIKL